MKISNLPGQPLDRALLLTNLHGGSSILVTVIGLSSDEAVIYGSGCDLFGTSVALYLDIIGIVEGVVAWEDEHAVGIRLLEPIDERALLKSSSADTHYASTNVVSLPQRILAMARLRKLRRNLAAIKLKSYYTDSLQGSDDNDLLALAIGIPANELEWEHDALIS